MNQTYPTTAGRMVRALNREYGYTDRDIYQSASFLTGTEVFPATTVTQTLMLKTLALLENNNAPKRRI